jgi:hypothetical protein
VADDLSAFEPAYGREPPPALRDLLADQSLRAATPCRLTLHRKPFVVEVQYYRGVVGQLAADIAAQRFAFAVNWDGHDMLVDLGGPDLPVLQREYGEIDALDFTLAELLAAAGGVE